MNSVTRTAKQAFSRLATLDLAPISFSLQNQEEGESWDKSTCEKVESAYRMFLALCISHPQKTLIPMRPVDKMWNFHILDTRKYSQDCQEYLGQFLHRPSYSGLRRKEDREEMIRRSQDTQALYLQEFGYDLSHLL